ncbi:hypothetical protein TNCV_4640491 [Trichonephila clavipes]|nr:hypothetical protein TNCV_4640491 [Trichonephila clavipes]
MDCVKGCLYTGSPSRQTIDGCACNGFMSTEPGKLISTKLFFQMNHASVWGTVMAAFVLYAMLVNAAFTECVIKRHSGLTTGVMVWSVISYHGRSNLLRIESNLSSNRNVREVLQPEVVPFLQRIHGAIFQQDNARPHVEKTVRDFCSSQHMQLLP